MDIETINTLTVVGFGNVALVFVIVWMIQTWREEISRNSGRMSDAEREERQHR